MTTTERLAAHCLAQNRGDRYPERDAEREWVRANLPATREEFDAVHDLVRQRWAGALRVNVAALLLDGAVTGDDTGLLGVASRTPVPPAWMAQDDATLQLVAEGQAAADFAAQYDSDLD